MYHQPVICPQVRFQPPPAHFRRLFLGIPVGGLLFGCGLVIACAGLTGASVSFFQTEHLAAWVVNAIPWLLTASLGITIVWRYKPGRVADRFKSSREMLEHMRIVHCEPDLKQDDKR